MQQWIEEQHAAVLHQVSRHAVGTGGGLGREAGQRGGHVAGAERGEVHARRAPRAPRPQNQNNLLNPHHTSASGALSECPGLLHFTLADRGAARCLAPPPHKHPVLTTKKLQRITSRAFRLFREGYTAATWRDSAVHVCAILWFERAGVTVSPRALHPAAVRALPPPGDILGSFYRQLIEQAFPNESSQVTVKELICIHLGLVPTATAVEQARRLAHTALDRAAEYTL
ncbi:hypothetical protein JYU34_017420 [Plutella xylostella]|uniref:FUZ/MON1/HPS1 third Longin domain-containing protein n=1 Tax=Plutella xylostella TaxID=51655 RepID=A0ABQ7Q2J2_PLUXY|nr:hypothetical protein JYU34_017420 [Plutella xylostella]